MTEFTIWLQVDLAALLNKMKTQPDDSTPLAAQLKIIRDRIYETVYLGQIGSRRGGETEQAKDQGEGVAGDEAELVQGSPRSRASRPCYAEPQRRGAKTLVTMSHPVALLSSPVSRFLADTSFQTPTSLSESAA